MAERDQALWQPGDAVVLRYVETPATVRMLQAINGDSVAPGASTSYPFLVNGEIVTVGARPYRVVMDTGDEVVLHQPEGTPQPRWHITEARYLDNPQRTRGETLRFLFADRGYDVTLFFEAAGELPWFYDALFDSDGLQAGWREQRRRSSAAAGTTGPRRGNRFRGWYVNMQSPFRRMPYGFDIVDHTLDIVVRPDRTWYWKDEDELALAVEGGACTPEEAEALRRTGEQAIEQLRAEQGPFAGEWTRWHPTSTEPVESFPDGWQTAPALLTDWATIVGG